MSNTGRFEKGHKRGVIGPNAVVHTTEGMQVLVSDGRFFLIDVDDLELIKAFRWYINKEGYVTGQNHITKKQIGLQRLLLDAPDGALVDHKNLNPLDNRRANLRLANRKQNAYNSRKRHTCSSKYKGVNFRPERAKWRAYITADKNTKLLGNFSTELEAAKAYDAAAKRHHGEFAKLNFPEGA